MFTKLNNRLRHALNEDGAFHDVTTRRLPGMGHQTVKADLHAKANGVLCGAFLIRPIFKMLDPKIRIKLKTRDGAVIKRGQILARIEGKAHAVLGGERTLLNLASHLSGVSTLTKRYTEMIKGTRAVILDTRKTTPLWRDLEKYAVRCGGGQNHRMSLTDAIMVKDNHHRYLYGRKLSVAHVYHTDKLNGLKGKKIKFVLVEAKTLPEVWDGIKARADIILLDNMSLERIKSSIALIHSARRALGTKTPHIEVSGGITLNQAQKFARIGAERISVGALTHSAPALDLSLEVL